MSIEEQQVDTNKKCQATLIIGIMIAEPLKNGAWRLIHVNNDSIGIVLDGYNHQDLMAQIYERLQEFKNLWEKTTSLKNTQQDANENQSSMDQNTI